tara:strand:+ start:539 stop:655 length:117 start_codon:yes stop_codon:yes gene_type:complete
LLWWWLFAYHHFDAVAQAVLVCLASIDDGKNIFLFRSI